MDSTTAVTEPVSAKEKQVEEIANLSNRIAEKVYWIVLLPKQFVQLQTTWTRYDKNGEEQNRRQIAIDVIIFILRLKF